MLRHSALKVHRVHGVADRHAGYVLLCPDGQPVATIEAKKLGEPLAAHRMQMLNYSNASGVEYAGLTDGDHWELHEVFKRASLRSVASLTCPYPAWRRTSALCGCCCSGGPISNLAIR